MEKCKVTDQNKETFITDGHCVNICAMIDGSYTPETIKANAHLIAAAPELLEACKSTVAWWNEWANSDNPTEVGDPDIYNAMKAINRAGGLDG